MNKDKTKNINKLLKKQDGKYNEWQDLKKQLETRIGVFSIIIDKESNDFTFTKKKEKSKIEITITKRLNSESNRESYRSMSIYLDEWDDVKNAVDNLIKGKK